MAFQTAINERPSLGVAGDVANIGNPVVYTVDTPMAGADVTVGHFCFYDDDGLVVPSGAVADLAGFVVRTLEHYNYDVKSSATMVISEGGTVPTARKGDFLCVSSTVATEGQSVFASATTGAISTGTGDAPAGSVATGYTVVRGGAVGDIITISNWS